MSLKSRWAMLPFSRQVFWATLALLIGIVFFVEVLGETILEPLFTSRFGTFSDLHEGILWCIGIVVPSLGSSWFLSRFVEKKLRGPAEASRRLAEGDLSARIDLRENREDAFGRVAVAFNTMAQKLEDLFTMERRLLADISHELRSPLTRMGMALALAERGADAPGARGPPRASPAGTPPRTGTAGAARSRRRRPPVPVPSPGTRACPGGGRRRRGSPAPPP